MILFLILIARLYLAQDSERYFFVQSLRIDFTPITPGITCNYADISCYTVLCDLLNPKIKGVSYVEFTPITTSDLNCTVPFLNVNTNMIMFGIGNISNIISPISCFTGSECLRIGCELYNKNVSVMQFLFTGQCL